MGNARPTMSLAASSWALMPQYDRVFLGVGLGHGAGPACNTCYSLSSSTAGTKSIVVKVNNLCPALGNEAMCAQKGISGTISIGKCHLARVFKDWLTASSEGANVNFDLCEDDGSSAAFSEALIWG